VTPLKIITYLKSLYGKITPQMLQANYDRLSDAWNPTNPINALWRQVKECRNFANKGGETIPETTVICLVLLNLELTLAFPMDMHNWINKPEEVQQDYNQLKVFFNKANKNHIIRLKKENSGFAGAATTPPPKQSPAKPEPTPSPTKPPPKNKQATSNKTDIGGLQYCFTHGFNYSHTSPTCRTKCDNHIDDANVTNMKGGNNMIQCKRGEKRIHVPPVYEKDAKKAKTEAKTDE
jgi:hypothetical protein